MTDITYIKTYEGLLALLQAFGSGSNISKAVIGSRNLVYVAAHLCDAKLRIESMFRGL